MHCPSCKASICNCPEPDLNVVHRLLAKLEQDEKRAKRDQRRADIIADNAKALRRLTKQDRKGWIVTAKQDVVKCDLLLTDPPQGITAHDWDCKTKAELERVTRDWAKRWNDCNARNIIVFWSIKYLEEGLRWFRESLKDYTYQRLLFQVSKNNITKNGHADLRYSTEIAILYKRNKTKRQIKSSNSAYWLDSLQVTKPQTNFNGDQRRIHPCQKPVDTMLWLVDNFTSEGETVADCFAGSGTVGMAAVALGRKAHLIENDKMMASTARGRIAAYIKKQKRDTK